jgi:hypothetical protein
MTRHWLVIYYDGNQTKAAIILDDTTDGDVTMPFGVEPHQVADDCVAITAIIDCDDNPTPMVVIDDEEFNLDPSDPAVEVEDVQAADEDEQD